MKNNIADVIVDINHQDVDKVFQYIIPTEIIPIIKKGMRVKVPFGIGNKQIEGYVIAIGNNPQFSMEKLKSISGLVDKKPVIRKELLQVAMWMKDRYCCTLTSAFKCILPKAIGKKKRMITKYLLDPTIDTEKILCELKSKNMNAQCRILEYFIRNERSVTAIELCKELKISRSSIQSLVNKHVLKISTENYHYEIFNKKIESTVAFELNDEQQSVHDRISKSINSYQYETFLLKGITGSGKTEVYMQIIDLVIKQNRQAIVLVPEISLTPQMVKRFVSRFGNLVGFTHSKLNESERIHQWRKAENGELSVMLGPRSAVFTPFERLGLIIIDEEHEHTYKSETTPKYHTREVAEKRCQLLGGCLILGSATPSVESYFKSINNEYNLLQINKRATKGVLPEVNIVDMREELALGNRTIFSRSLLEAMMDRLQKKEQIILFLNRRGHSTFVSCRNCGLVMKCYNCDIPYTYHATEITLRCHHCGNRQNIPKICPKCGSKYIKYFGVGTQKVQNTIKELLPKANVIRMDLDTTGKKNAHENILNQFSEGNADILVGTQMIAKGLDFHNVTLVGVIAADLTLYSQDYRAAEKTFQLLTQVSGRAGRGEKKGKVYIQTYTPDHYSILAAKNHNYVEFYEKEIKLRKMMDYPPYSNIFTYLITGKNEDEVIKYSNILKDILQFYGKKRNFQILGPSPAVLSMIKQQYRWRIFVKHKEYDRLKNYGKYCLDKFRETYKRANISIHIDINPYYLS